MSTRGLYGFKKNGEVKAVYNHFDSYPEGLGSDFVKFLLVLGKEGINGFFDRIEAIDPEIKPTAEQKQYCESKGWYDGSVGERSKDDWYCLLRGLQDMDALLESAEDGSKVYIENRIDFIKDSLFCEYAYIYDADRACLEFYVGFQKEPQPGNPFGEEPDEDGYYPCRLMAEIPLKGKSRHDIMEEMSAAAAAS